MDVWLVNTHKLFPFVLALSLVRARAPNFLFHSMESVVYTAVC